MEGFSPRACIEWKCLQKLHLNSKVAAHLPNFPVTITITGDASTSAYLAMGETASKTFTGTPCLLRPILKELMRFDRPFITWDILTEAPPNTFPTVPKHGVPNCEPCDGEATGDGEEPLRDPRIACNVEHSGWTQGQRKKGLQVQV